jgi:hypothetical protein
MDMKKLLESIDTIDSGKKEIKEMASMNISMNADSADEVGRLLDIVKGAAGADHAHTVGPDDMPEMPPMPLKGTNDMRTDMENFSSIVNRAEEEVGEEEVDENAYNQAAAAAARAHKSEFEFPPGSGKMHPVKMSKDTAHKLDDDYANEPDEEYADTQTMTKDLSGGLNREKKAYKKAAGGDNPMALEDSIKARLWDALSEMKEGTCNECGNQMLTASEKKELAELAEGERHGNSKIYKKCWKGCTKVAGKKRGEPGSCKCD